MPAKQTANRVELSGNAANHSKAELAQRKANVTTLPVVPATPTRVRCPAHLGKVGKKKFRELMRDAIFPNAETAAHFAKLFEQKVEADNDIVERGTTIESERGFKANPSVRFSSDLAREMTKLLSTCSTPKGDPASDFIAAMIERTKGNATRR